MKTEMKIFFIAVLFAAFANSAQAQEKNPVLKNTFPTSSGNLLIADVWKEIRISDLSYETVQKLINTVESLAQDLKNAISTISEQKRTIEKMQRELDDQKRKLDKIESEIRYLKNKVK